MGTIVRDSLGFKIIYFERPETHSRYRNTNSAVYILHCLMFCFKARVVCQELGFSGGEATRESQFGRVSEYCRPYEDYKRTNKL